MNWLDVLILIGLAASVMSGLTKGVVRGVVNLLGVLFGVFMAGRFYEMASGWLGLIHNQNVAHAVAFMAIVIVFMILAGLLGAQNYLRNYAWLARSYDRRYSGSVYWGGGLGCHTSLMGQVLQQRGSKRFSNSQNTAGQVSTGIEPVAR
jgi:hypothetical protein